MQIVQTNFITTQFTLLNAEAPYNNSACLVKASDTTKWSEVTYHRWMYPNEFLTGESMSGKVIAKVSGDGNNLQIKSATIDTRNMNDLNLVIHNPFPYAIVVDCISYDRYNSIIDNDRHIIKAYDDYVRYYQTPNDFYSYAVSLPDDKQYPEALVGLSQFAIYSGNLITEGFTGCRIVEEIDYTNFISNSAYITGIGNFPIQEKQVFTIYDDNNRLYGSFIAEQIDRHLDGTYECQAYDISYCLANKLSRGDWFEGHTVKDAIKNIFTYGGYEWSSELGNAEMESFMDISASDRITGLIEYETPLREAVTQISLSQNSYAHVDRDGKLRLKPFTEIQTPKVITRANEIIGRKVSKNSRSTERVIVVDFENEPFSENTYKTVKYNNYATVYNDMFTDGITSRPITRTKSQLYFKNYIWSTSTNRYVANYRFDGERNTFTFDTTNAPTPAPSECNRVYLEQLQLWSGQLDLILIGECSEGRQSDDWTTWSAYPQWHPSEGAIFYDDWSNVTIHRSFTSSVSSSTIAHSLYDRLQSDYTIRTQVLPDYNLNVGDYVIFEEGNHEGYITTIDTNLYDGGIIDITVECY